MSGHRGSERRPSGERPAGAAALIPQGLDAHLVLLRHGETDFIVDGRFQGQMDSGLTRAGEAQIRLAAQRLAAPAEVPALPLPDSPPAVIVHSPLGRARRSAEIVADALREAGRALPPLRPDPGMLEIAQGGWEGLTGTEIEERFPGMLGAWRRWPERNHAPGGESTAQVLERVERSLGTVLGELAEGAARGTLDRHQVLGYSPVAASDRWALLVAHGGVFRIVTCALLGLSLDHFWNFDFGLGSITIFEIRAGRAVLRAVNLDAHLADLAAEAAAESEARDATGAL